MRYRICLPCSHSSLADHLQPLLINKYWARWILHPNHYSDFLLLCTEVESFLMLAAAALLPRNGDSYKLHKKSQLTDRASSGMAPTGLGWVPHTSTILRWLREIQIQPTTSLSVSSPLQPSMLILFLQERATISILRVGDQGKNEIWILGKLSGRKNLSKNACAHLSALILSSPHAGEHEIGKEIGKHF